MAREDFEALYQRLGLSSEGLSVDATMRPDLLAQTRPSAPRPPLPPPPADEGTMPRLMLDAPDLARGPNAESELVPVEVLGEGGMGRVLLARQHSLGRDVAVKVLKSNALNDGAAAALILEARTTGSLEHPGVVPVYALARDGNGHPALVMKRVEGVSWRELLRDPDHPAWQSIGRTDDHLEANLEILISVCNAIAHAHQRGVIHRDLKPANVLIGELGETYVADWGVAVQKKDLVDVTPRLVGTPAYLAPEMVGGDPRLTDERTDVYLLGATLYEVLTGHPPHLAATLHEVLEKAFHSVPPPLPATVPRELAQLCLTALAPNPADRFQTVLELRDAVRIFLAVLGSIRLVAAATVRLADLQALLTDGGTDPQRWYTLFSEVRFNFTQALQAFPLNNDARRGLKQCLQLALRRELKLGNLGSARGLMVELEGRNPAPELVEGLRTLEAAEVERVTREAKLKSLEHEQNPSVSATQRNLLLGLLAAIIMSTALLTPFFKGQAYYLGFGKWGPLFPISTLLVLYAVAVAVGRRALLSTRLNRQQTMVAGINLVALLATRLMGIALAVPLASTLAIEGMMLAALAGLIAVLWHRGLGWGALLFSFGGLGSAVFPEQAVPIFSALNGLALLSQVWVLRQWRTEVRRAALTG